MQSEPQSLTAILQETLEELEAPCRNILTAPPDSLDGELLKNDKKRKDLALHCATDLLARMRSKAQGNTQEELDERALREAETMEGQCGVIIRLFYLKKMSLKEIGKMVSLKYGSMKNKRGQCLKELNLLTVRRLIQDLKKDSA
jgi:DNA-directed RNA polymerase specialized sigma subunit